MTAVNVILRPGEAHVVTDGAACRLGKFMSARVKVLPAPHLGVAIAASGDCSVLDSLLFDATKYASIAELRENLPKLLRRRYWLAVKILPWVFAFELVVAGVDKDGHSFAFTTSSVARPGEPAFAVHEVEYAHVAPAYDGVEDDLPYDDEDIGAAGIRLIDRQRTVPRDFGLDKGSQNIGAFVQLTSIYGSGIETRALKTYPDLVGQPIG